MSTVTNTFYFNPSPNASWQQQFTGTLADGTVTNLLLIGWYNQFSASYYLVCTYQGNTVFQTPLVASPDNINFDLSLGQLATQVVYRESTGFIEIIQP